MRNAIRLRKTSSSLSALLKWLLCEMSSSSMSLSRDRTAMWPSCSNITTSLVSPSLGSSMMLAVNGDAVPFEWVSMAKMTGSNMQLVYCERRPLIGRPHTSPPEREGGDVRGKVEPLIASSEANSSNLRHLKDT